MIPVQAIHNINVDELPGYEERRQMTLYGPSISPIQKLDAAMKESIYEALWKDDVLWAEYHQIDVLVKDNIVYLNGHIISAANQERIENAIWAALPDIQKIENNLILDDELTFEVAKSLSDLENAYDCKFFTGAMHGVISLNGLVDTENAKQLAGQCVTRNLNVRGVINHVRVSDDHLSISAQKFLQPGIGAIIYFMDGIFGVVKQVIVSAHNRCVIQVVVQGRFSSQKQDLLSLAASQEQIPETMIVLPVDSICYLTDSSGFLTVKGAETIRYDDFDPLRFTRSKTDWVPPYPYRLSDVLFMADSDLEPLNNSASTQNEK